MRRAVALLMMFLLAVLHAPSSAQALMSSFLPDLFPLGTTEPAMLLLTGIALLSLARVGK
jgi:CBS-domain-containing membrane protein